MADAISRSLLYESNGQHELSIQAAWRPDEALRIRRLLEQEEDAHGPAYDSDMTWVIAAEAIPAFLASLPSSQASVEAALDWAAADPEAARRLVEAARDHGESQSNWFWIH